MQNQPELGHRRKTNRRSFVLLFSSATTWLLHQCTSVADDLLSIRRARRRIQPLCSVPEADYQHEARTPCLIVRSLPALPRYGSVDINMLTTVIESYARAAAEIESAEIPDATPQQLAVRADLALNKRIEGDAAERMYRRPISKLLQLADSQLAIAHCSVSDVALIIEPTGIWHLSLRGDQNYLRLDEARQRNLDLQIKRNAFKVKIRLLQSIRAGGENLTPRVGSEPDFAQASKHAFVAIDVPEFWIQREAPQLITQTGHHRLISAHFDDIDQAEFEFFVKLDPLTGNGQGVVQTWQK